MAWISRRIGATRRFAKFNPNQISREEDDQRNQREHRRKGDLNAELFLFQQLVVSNARLGDGRELERARIDGPGHEKNPVLVRRQFEQGAENIAFPRHETDRVLIVRFAQVIGSRQRQPFNGFGIDPFHG